MQFNFNIDVMIIAITNVSKEIWFMCSSFSTIHINIVVVIIVVVIVVVIIVVVIVDVVVDINDNIEDNKHEIQ